MRYRKRRVRSKKAREVLKRRRHGKGGSRVTARVEQAVQGNPRQIVFSADFWDDYA